MSTSIVPRISGHEDTMPVADRRVHPRYHLRLAVTLRGDNNFYTGVSSDISEGGIFIATQYMLPIGTPVVMQFHISRFGADLTLRGTVRWIRAPEAMARGGEVFGGAHVTDVKPGMGVQFDEMGPEEARIIREFMRCRTPELFD
ncbi:MAG: PilZ domain-containing protein [Labilithrix sp.]|nr:PilZ domain-containing protein [Labilithrix sp.]MCW5816154.1 PilZ domain-containing protein [Labilithrix sp.]